MSLKETQTGKFFMGGHSPSGLILPEDQLKKDMEKARLEREASEAGKILIEAEKQKQADLDAKLATLEMLPMLNKIILQAYPRNPYKQLVKGSILVDYHGEFKNPDSGEEDVLKELVGCAKVIEVGPEVKYLKPGDDIYYDTRTCYPVPFMSMGYLLTSEPQILCVLNEGLKARFNMNQDTSI